MKKNKNPFTPALEGLKILFSKERNFQIHIAITILALVACFLFQVKPWEWATILIMIALVLSAEALNTAIEKTCDYVCQERHPQIKKIKDIAAGGVLICAFIAVAVGCIIFIPYLLGFFAS